jgi:hypothetical protein
MSKANQTGSLKPIVTCHGDQELFSSLHAQLAQRLPKEPVEWQRPFGRSSSIQLCLDPNFVPFSEELVPGNLQEGNVVINLHEFPFLHIYWTDCTDTQAYKSHLKDNISSWLQTLNNKRAQDWLIIVVIQHDSILSKPKGNVLDKIKVDFCSKVPRRCILLKHSAQHQDAKLNESWQIMLGRIRELMLQSFSKNLPQLEEAVRNMREKRQNADWTFSSYFILQEQLSFVYEMLEMHEDALIQYNELDAMFSQLVAEARAKGTPKSFSNYASGCRTWHGANLFASVQETKEQRQLISDGHCSLLQFRNYLFVQQSRLLRRLNRGYEIIKKTFTLASDCLHELAALQVPLMDGVDDVWVYLTCIQVLNSLENTDALMLGLETVPAHTISVLRAELWKYAWEKLHSIGYECSLMEPERESTSPKAIELMHGIMGSEIGGVESSEASSKLCSALCSPKVFDETYIELGETALAAFNHVGRRRFAAQIGYQLSIFLMTRGEFERAEPLLTDSCQIQDAENWHLLTANVLVPLADCLLKLGQMDKYVSACSSLACADPSLPTETHEHYYKELLRIAKEEGSESIPLPFEVIFKYKGVQAGNEEGVFYVDDEVVVMVQLISNIYTPLTLERVAISLHCMHTPLLQSPVHTGIRPGLKEWSAKAKLMPSDREIKRIQRLGKKQKQTSGAGDDNNAEETENIQLNQVEERNSPVSFSSSSEMSSTDFAMESIAGKSEESNREGEEMDGMDNELLVESLEMTQDTHTDTNNPADGSIVGTRVDDDNWSISDDTDSVSTMDAKLVWLENHNCTINPGPNTLTLSGQISAEGQYIPWGLLFELGALQYCLHRVPMPRRKQGIVVLPQSPDVEISVEGSNGGYLLVDKAQRVHLRIATNRQSIPMSSTLQLETPKGFFIQQIISASILSGLNNQVNVNVQVSFSKVDSFVVTSLVLPAVGPKSVLDVVLQVMANQESNKSSRCREVTVAVSCLWYSPVHKLYLSMKFFTPIKPVFKLLTAQDRQFLQALISNTFPADLIIMSVKVACGHAKLQPMRDEMEQERTVIPSQTMAYLWVTSMG